MAVDVAESKERAYPLSGMAVAVAVAVAESKEAAYPVRGYGRIVFRVERLCC